MTNIVQMSYLELKAAIKDSIRESLAEIKAIPDLPEKPDRCSFQDMLEITGSSKGQGYKLTSTGEVPHQKFGKRLVFSRREITAWMEDRTTRKISPFDQAVDQLQATANKKLR